MEFKKTINKKQDCKAFGFKHSKAQHLVELVLFFPFLIGIIGVLTEIAYGLNTGVELNSAINNAVSNTSSIQRTSENASIKTIEKEIYEDAHKILVARKIPYADSLKVEILEAEGFYIIIGSYDYTYAFKLVNLFFNAIPEKFYFKSIVATNKALFLPNSYGVFDSDLTSDFDSYEGGQTTDNGENTSEEQQIDTP